ncbi:citrate lyase holo-[acyl-carrier protein] synthase [Lactobacillus sp. ESL0679]|uniref:citrate lyase holo-[acyl-carrier protein] synthase n=1 Tax=Lactobacillus sp. ESL0679 TaxID=2983209 RepID=UPI0023F8D9F1|nr:citrate lyase holo-[acyl-carrier protein] synthase [Lactobacillus sp. ESL0679]MDF7682742.1 citrate lyase holo-[acyl-carrier protein] synthase [Lactobacillus sp. ESL0679]
MNQSIFLTGTPQSIPDVLAAKDQRVALQTQLFNQNPSSTLLDIKLNIPGPIKNNHYLKQLFTTGCTNLEKDLKAQGIKYNLVTSWDNPSGCENFYLLNANAKDVKQVTITFEDENRLGRLFDADVLIKEQNAALSRSKLGLPVRRCFLCNRPAKECARSRRHSVAELQNYISNIYNEEFS